jgi:hypothetical protein
MPGPGDKRREVLALGRVGWTLRHIEQATGVRRETASTYLKATGIPVRDPALLAQRLTKGGWAQPLAERCSARSRSVADASTASATGSRTTP